MFRCSSLAIATFAVGSLLLLTLFAFAASDGLRLWCASSRFSPVQGVVAKSEIVQRPGSKGRIINGALIECEYAVGGQRYTTRRVTIDDPDALQESWHGKLPVGAVVTVWFDPTNPSRSLLHRGFTPTLMLWCEAMAWTLGLVVVFGIDAIEAVVWQARQLAAGVVVHQNPRGQVLQLSAMSAPAVGAAVMSVVALAGSVVWLVAGAAGWLGEFVRWPEAAALLGGTLLSAVGAFAYERHRMRSGARDLVIDDTNGVIMVPAGPARPHPQSIPLSSIEDVDTVVWEHVNQTQGGSVTTYTFVPTLVYRSELGGWRNCHLVEWRDEGKASALVKWLRSRVGPRCPKVGKGGEGIGGAQLGSILDGIETEP